MAAEHDPYEAERERLRVQALRRIRQYPDPVLRMVAREVTTFDQDLSRLAHEMIELMRDAQGIGLAANQVGVLQRIFVLEIEDEVQLVAVNPTITPLPELEVSDEGCLSLQHVHVPVERHLALRLDAQDERGNPFQLELEGLAARAVQHELDHLDGTLILDRTTQEARREALATLRPKLVGDPAASGR
jgi:peptide deformylase